MVSEHYKQIVEWLKKTDLTLEGALDLSRQKGSKQTDSRWFEGSTWLELTEPWKGFIDWDKKSLIYGALISQFDGKPLVIRGYPQIHSEGHLKGEIIQPKYDGIHIEFYKAGENIFAKTRSLEYTNRFSLKNRNYWMLLEGIGITESAKNLIKDYPNYVVVGELYGNDDALRGVIEYNVKAAFKAFDILDTKTHKYLHWKESYELFEKYQIPKMPIIEYSKAESLLHGEAFEGVVSKFYGAGDIYIDQVISRGYKDLLERDKDLVDGARARLVMRKVLEGS